MKICPCLGCDAHPGSCPNIVERGRCPRCTTVVRQRRGTTTEQGLGWQHQQHRARLIQDAIGTPCPDCGDTMTEPRLMVADHPDQDRTKPATRVHCRRCSDKQGGRLSTGTAGPRRVGETPSWTPDPERL